MRLALFSLALGLTSAKPTPPIRRAPDSPSFIQIPLDAPDTTIEVLTLDEVHQNVLGSWPAHLTLQESELQQYLDEHEGTPVMVYLQDTRQWIKTTPPQSTNGTLDRRECTLTTKVMTLAAQSYWGSWVPITTCFENGKNTEENSQSISFSNTWGTDYSFGIGIGGNGAANIPENPANLIKDFSSSISLNFGVSYSSSYSESNSYSCNAPPIGSSQLWAQHKYGWNALAVGFTSCGSDLGFYYGWATSPFAGNSTIGCSSNSYVDCDNS